MADKNERMKNGITEAFSELRQSVEEMHCWLVWGRTLSNFCELLAVCTSEDSARVKERYIRRSDVAREMPRLAEIYVEKREMDHAFGESMYGIGPLPRTRKDLEMRE